MVTMGIADYFRPVSSKSAEEVREFLKERLHSDYNLVDVRQPKEYEKEHLPGALLIPVGDLRERARELDPSKPTIAY